MISTILCCLMLSVCLLFVIFLFCSWFTSHERPQKRRPNRKLLNLLEKR